MDMKNRPPQSGRETIVTFALLALLGGAFFLFLNLVSLGIFFYVAAAIVGMAAIGFLHYVVWGYDLSEEVGEDRRREWLERQQEFDDR